MAGPALLHNAAQDYPERITLGPTGRDCQTGGWRLAVGGLRLAINVWTAWSKGLLFILYRLRCIGFPDIISRDAKGRYPNASLPQGLRETGTQLDRSGGKYKRAHIPRFVPFHSFASFTWTFSFFFRVAASAFLQSPFSVNADSHVYICLPKILDSPQVVSILQRRPDDPPSA